jgi:hypothetical protein
LLYARHTVCVLSYPQWINIWYTSNKHVCFHVNNNMWGEKRTVDIVYEIFYPKKKSSKM